MDRYCPTAGVVPPYLFPLPVVVVLRLGLSPPLPSRYFALEKLKKEQLSAPLSEFSSRYVDDLLP